MRKLRKIGIIMLIFGVVFAMYALKHPEASLPLSAEKVKNIYRLYVVLTILFLIWPFGAMGGKKRKKKKDKR